MTPDDPRIRRNHRAEQEAADRHSTWPVLAFAGVLAAFFVVVAVVLTIGGAR